MTSLAPWPTPSLLHLRLAVVGARLAGLVAAQELHREGHCVVVFERGKGAPGSIPLLWNPTRSGLTLPETSSIQSLYHSLRTNLPRECIGFLDCPFVPRGGGDARWFPGHEEMLRYLENFAEEFGLLELIRFNTEVERVEREVDGRRWIVESGEMGNDGKKNKGSV